MIRNALVGVLAMALVAVAGMQAVTFRRLQRLQEQVAAAGREKDSTRARSAAAAPEALSGEMAPNGPAVAPAPAGLEPVGGETLSTPAKGHVTPEQVEEIVQRALKERDAKNPMRAVLDIDSMLEDPLAVMERELQLSPAQKLRIQEHMKARDEAFQESWKEESKFDPKKWQEMEESCEASIKGELDYAQQQKYDELKKSGKILGAGGAVVFSSVQTVQKVEPKDGK